MTKPLRELLTQREYARRRNLSHTAVQKAIRDGRLAKSLVRVGKRTRVDPAMADREWASTTDPLKQRDDDVRAGGVAPGTPPPNAGHRAPPAADHAQPGLFGTDPLEHVAAGPGARAPGTDDDTGESAEPPGPNYQRLRAFDMGFRVQLQKLELEERSGQLVRASAVAAESFRTGRHVRDALLRIPSRMVGTLMSETDPRAFEQALLNEILKALEILANEPATPPGAGRA